MLAVLQLSAQIRWRCQFRRRLCYRRDAQPGRPTSVLLYSRRYDSAAQRVLLALRTLPHTRITVEVATQAGLSASTPASSSTGGADMHRSGLVLTSLSHSAATAAFQRVVSSRSPDIAVCLDGGVSLYAGPATSQLEPLRPLASSDEVSV